MHGPARNLELTSHSFLCGSIPVLPLMASLMILLGSLLQLCTEILPVSWELYPVCWHLPQAVVPSTPAGTHIRFFGGTFLSKWPSKEIKKILWCCHFCSFSSTHALYLDTYFNLYEQWWETITIYEPCYARSCGRVSQPSACLWAEAVQLHLRIKHPGFV